MRKAGFQGRSGRLAVLAGTLVLGGWGARAVPAQGVGPRFSIGGSPRSSTSGTPRRSGQELAQIFPGSGGPGGNTNLAQGRQGGVFSQGGTFSLGPGGSTQLVAFCTDLMSDPPDETTRFRGGTRGTVVLADGSTRSLSSAMQAGLVALRGRSNSFDPVRRDGSLALDLYLANTAGMPLQVSLDAGTSVTPQGQADQPLPGGATKLFDVARERRLATTNTMQFAVWAARGSTAEDVEQTQMLRLTEAEIDKVQGLLNDSGIRKEFDVNRGLYAARYDSAVEHLGKSARPLEGSAFLVSGSKVAVDGVRGADDTGYVRVRPVKRGGEFFYAAKFEDRPDGRVSVSLRHLQTGRPIHVNRASLLVYPASRA